MSTPRRSLGRTRAPSVRSLAAVVSALAMLFGVAVGPAATASVAEVDLAVTQKDSPDPVLLGVSVTYTVTIANLSQTTAASNVELTDTLPSGATFEETVPAGACDEPAGGELTCTFGSIVSGETAEVQITVSPGGAGLIKNIAKVKGDEADPNPGNDSSTEETTVNEPAAQANIGVGQTDNPDPANVGQNVIYTVVVSNAGPDAATEVTLKDTLVANAAFQNATPSQGTCKEPSGGELKCGLGPIPVGGDEKVVIRVAPTKSGNIANAAEVSANEEDPKPGNNVDTEGTIVVGLACTITGTAGDDPNLDGTPGNDVICGLGGNDVIDGMGGNDRVDGGAGNDRMEGGDGSDELYGRAGRDRYAGGPGFDLARFDGSPKPVTVSLPDGTANGDGSDKLSEIEGAVGSPDDDFLTGDGNANEFYGRRGDDKIAGGGAFDYARYDFARGRVSVRLSEGTASGSDGRDKLAGIEGVIGSNHDDALQGDRAENRLFGRGGDDTIKGNDGFDYVGYDLASANVKVSLANGTASGGDGNDTLFGIEGILGSPFDDALAGSSAANTISGRAGADILRGGSGPDSLFGDDGNDRLFGQIGNDYLDGGAGNDALDGGPDRDRCLQGTGTGSRTSCESS